MKNSISPALLTSLLATAFAATGCPMLQQSDSGSGTTTTTTTTTGGGNTGTPVDPVLAAVAGNWDSGCMTTSNINGAAAHFKRTITIGTDGTASMVTSYYPTACSSGTTMIWEYSPATVTVGSATTQPANGHLLRFVLTSSQNGVGIGLFTQSSAGASHLNTQCNTSVFTSNGGVGLGSSGFSCSGDSRFAVSGPGASADVVVVPNGTTMSTTQMVTNLPGVVTGVPLDTTTSMTFTKY